MDVKVGDRIAVETERVGQAGRQGEVLEIVEGAAVSLRVRSGWVAALTSPKSRDSRHHADSGRLQASTPCTAKRGTS